MVYMAPYLSCGSNVRTSGEDVSAVTGECALLDEVTTACPTSIPSTVFSALTSVTVTYSSYTTSKMTTRETESTASTRHHRSSMTADTSSKARNTSTSEHRTSSTTGTLTIPAVTTIWPTASPPYTNHTTRPLPKSTWAGSSVGSWICECPSLTDKPVFSTLNPSGSLCVAGLQTITSVHTTTVFTTYTEISLSYITLGFNTSPLTSTPSRLNSTHRVTHRTV